MGLLKEIVLFPVPRFVTDRVALSLDDKGVWSVFCLEGQEIPGDNIFIEAYGTINTFTWFGITRGGNVELDDK